MRAKWSGLVFLGVSLLVSCVSMNSPNIPTYTAYPQPLPISTQNGLLVFEINDFSVDHEYCQSPDVFLSHVNAQGMSDDELAHGLMKLWLDYFNTSQTPDYCRIDGYTIEKVYYDERTPYLPLVPKGDINRVIHFSVKLIQYPNFWSSWAGEVDEGNWLHTGANLAVFRVEAGYMFEFARP